jgi:hypothetical protein
MAFDITINKEEQDKFLKIMALYPDFMYVNGAPIIDKYHLIFLGEDTEKDSLLQEALMEHLESVEIVESIGG